MSIDKLRRDLEGFDEDPDWYVIKQKDGTTFRCHKDDRWKAFWSYWMECAQRDAMREERPPVPPLLRAVAGAVAPWGAMKMLFPEWPARDPHCAMEYDALMRGELVPTTWAWGACDEWDDDGVDD